MASQLSLFSKNEHVDEVTTTDLKYVYLASSLSLSPPSLQPPTHTHSLTHAHCFPLRFLLLPALLGDLTLQLCEGERLEVINAARVYCVDYLQRCKAYAITKEVCECMY